MDRGIDWLVGCWRLGGDVHTRMGVKIGLFLGGRNANKKEGDDGGSCRLAFLYRFERKLSFDQR